jgi:hypothetical protein
MGVIRITAYFNSYAFDIANDAAYFGFEPPFFKIGRPRRGLLDRAPHIPGVARRAAALHPRLLLPRRLRRLMPMYKLQGWLWRAVRSIRFSSGFWLLTLNIFEQTYLFGV